MSRRSVVLLALVLISALWPATLAFSQCKNQISLVPLAAQKAASKARDFIRFSYALSPSDSLLIRSHEDSETTLGPQDIGIAIKRDGRTIQNVPLRYLPEFRRQDPTSVDNFTTLAVTRACRGDDAIYFITMQWKGDETSPALVFTLIPSPQGYGISALPSISGGVLEVSAADPLHFRTWDSLDEGMCNACETAYRITEYKIQDGKPVQTRRYRTRRLYTSGNDRFDDRRRIRFIP
jgi:hypothetical protein